MAATDIELEADRCVMCGLCLPHCPTYAKTRDEGESPRGRISLMAALASGRLEPGARLQAHLDQCLVCRACERVCPSNVRYGRMIDAARARLRQHRAAGVRGPGRLQRAVERTLARPRALRAAGRLLWLYQRVGLRALLQRSGILRAMGLTRADALLPPVPRPQRLAEHYRGGDTPTGRVALFTGCVAPLLEPATLTATVSVLNACGYAVAVPPGQGCCGAVHLHAGAEAGALALARRNGAAFGPLDVEAVVSTATGCGATLAEYDLLETAPAPSAVGALAARAQDIHSFLLRSGRLAGLAFKPLPQRVAVHDPCTLTHVLRAQDAPYALLAHIPALEVAPLAGNRDCCGAAGPYMLEHPAMADALLADKLKAIDECGAKTVVTSNIGCALHIAAGLRARRSTVEVIHPMVLLARQLGTGGAAR